MKLIVGLGNPGEQYKYTKHNVGFLVIDKICEKLNIKLNKNKFEGSFAILDDIIFAKPKTFMNKSGEFVKAICGFYKIHPSDVLVIHDEINMELGRASIKIGGSAGGHNGINDIIHQLNSAEFKKLKIGVGRDIKKELKDDVLGKLSLDEISKLEIIFEKAADAACSFAFNDINKVMEQFNINRRNIEE